MSIIINGNKLEIPGLATKSWLDQGSPKWLKEITDFNPRTRSVHFIVAHTHKGIPGKLLSGYGQPSSEAQALIRYQTNTDRAVSWDYTVDSDGTVYVQNDPIKKYSWQAGSVNSISLGFEMVQTPTGDLYEGQIEKTVLLIDALTAYLGIQRQIPWNLAKNSPRVGTCVRLEQEKGENVVGIVGHRNITKDRGAGDPGDLIYLALKKAGYESFDLDSKDDINTWKTRQVALGIPLADCDGIPLKKTVMALKASGKPFGMYVSRPVDAFLTVI